MRAVSDIITARGLVKKYGKQYGLDPYLLRQPLSNLRARVAT